MHRINLLHSSCSFFVYLTFIISFVMFPYGLLPYGLIFLIYFIFSLSDPHFFYMNCRSVSDCLVQDRYLVAPPAQCSLFSVYYYA